MSKIENECNFPPPVVPGDKAYKHYTNLTESQKKINTGIHDRNFDTTQQYLMKPEVRSKETIENQNDSMKASGMVDFNNMFKYNDTYPSNAVSKYATADASPGNYQNSQGMSDAYIQMKHMQEKQQLMDNNNSNMKILGNLQTNQEQELQSRLNTPNNTNTNELAPFDSFFKTTYSGLNFDQHQNKKANAYMQMKQMAPNDLNNMYGRQSDTPIFPSQNVNGVPSLAGGGEINDIFSMTSYNPQRDAEINSNKDRTQKLQGLENINKNAYSSIMQNSEKTVLMSVNNQFDIGKNNGYGNGWSNFTS